MRRKRSFTRATSVLGLVLAGLAVPAVLGSVPAATSAPYGLHVAFTDERDELWQAPIVLGEGGVLPSPDMDPGLVLGDADHTGEAYVMPALGSEGTLTAYVSTRGDASGDVYLDVDGVPTQVTCANSAVETHPVTSPGGDDIAYASNIGGDWNIFIATRVEDPPPSGEPVVNAAALPGEGGGGVCEGFTARAVTTDPGDDLWPAWASGGDEIVFSSTREFEGIADPLGDLFLADVDAGGPENLVRRLTLLEGADTQPTVAPGLDGLVAFTSTRDRPDGSLSFLFLPTDDTLPIVRSGWAAALDAQQAGEPAFPPTSQELHLAWTSTQDDPLGDVWAGQVRVLPEPDGGEPFVEIISAEPVAAQVGVAESHAAWIDELSGASDSDGTLAYTRRSEDADISEVLAADGSGRRGMISHDDGDPSEPFVYDEAGPSYSPDGQRVAYSRDVAGGEDDGRELVVEDVDGTTPQVLLAGRARGEVDVDPVWSPDGTRIAFTRYGWSGGEIPQLSPDVWVVDLASGAADSISRIPEGASGVQDLDPTWSPRGNRIALARSYSSQWRESGAVELHHDVSWMSADSRFGGCIIATANPEIADRTDCASFDYDDGDAFYLDEVSEGTELSFPEFRDRLSAGDDVTGTYETEGASTFVLVEEDRTPTDVAGSRGAAALAWGPTEIWIVDAVNGSNAERLVYPGDCSLMVACTPARFVHGDSPAWSPDGERIAFEHLGGVRMVRLQSTDVPEAVIADSSVTGFTGRDGEGPATPARESIAVTEDPAWSPDGSEIAFAGQPAGQPDQRGIYAVQPDGTGLRTIAQDRGPETEPAYGFRPPPPPPADVAVTLTVSGTPALTGDPMIATYTVTNNGPGLAEGVTLTTGAAAGGTTTSTSPGCAPDGSGCPARSMAPGESYVYEVSLVYGDPLDGLVTGQVSTTSVDPDLSNNDVRAPFTVRGRADVAVAVAVIGSPAEVGDPLTASYTVTNDGPNDADDVALVTGATAGGEPVSSTPGCDAAGSGCDPRDLASGASFTYDVVLTYDEPLSGTATGQVSSSTADPDPGNNAAQAPFIVGDVPPPDPDAEADLRVDLTFDRDLGWVGGSRTATITVTNRGPDLAQAVALEVTYPGMVEVAQAPLPCLVDGESCELGDLASGEDQELTVELDLRRPGREPLVASAVADTADPSPDTNTDSVVLTVRQPVLRVLPAVGRPGQVVLAYGEDFPPRTLVELAWDVGITIDRGPFRVDPDGTLRVPLLLVRHDRLGNRELVARSVPREFSPVRAPTLVVARMMAPPDFLTRG